LTDGDAALGVALAGSTDVAGAGASPADAMRVDEERA
jgi:hypothetical protein